MLPLLVEISDIVTYLVDFLISFDSYPRLLAVLVAIAICSHFLGESTFDLHKPSYSVPYSTLERRG